MRGLESATVESIALHRVSSFRTDPASAMGSIVRDAFHCRLNRIKPFQIVKELCALRRVVRVAAPVKGTFLLGLRHPTLCGMSLA